MLCELSWTNAVFTLPALLNAVSKEQLFNIGQISFWRTTERASCRHVITINWFIFCFETLLENYFALVFIKNVMWHVQACFISVCGPCTVYAIFIFSCLCWRVCRVTRTLSCCLTSFFFLVSCNVVYIVVTKVASILFSIVPASDMSGNLGGMIGMSNHVMQIKCCLNNK